MLGGLVRNSPAKIDGSAATTRRDRSPRALPPRFMRTPRVAQSIASRACNLHIGNLLRHRALVIAGRLASLIDLCERPIPQQLVRSAQRLERRMARQIDEREPHRLIRKREQVELVDAQRAGELRQSIEAESVDTALDVVDGTHVHAKL